jgi:hypothetical protein
MIQILKLSILLVPPLLHYLLLLLLWYYCSSALVQCVVCMNYSSLIAVAADADSSAV